MQGQVFRDANNRYLGQMEIRSGKLELRDCHNRLLGVYDGRETRDAGNRLIGIGNLLMTLLRQSP